MKRILFLIAALAFCVLMTACGGKPEPSGETTTAEAATAAPTEAPTEATAAVPATEPTAAPTAAPTEAPTAAPAEPEDLLAWGGKTISGFGRAWAERTFVSVEAEGTDEEDADCASYAFKFSESEKEPGLSLNGSIYLGKDASVLFDIPEEAELDPLAEGFLAEQVKLLLPEAKEETMTVGKTAWNVCTFCQNEAADGFAVYDLIAWTEADGVLAYVNAAAVLSGAGIGEGAEQTLTDLAQEWFSSLEIR